MCLKIFTKLFNFSLDLVRHYVWISFIGVVVVLVYGRWNFTTDRHVKLSTLGMVGEKRENVKTRFYMFDKKYKKKKYYKTRGL